MARPPRALATYSVHRSPFHHRCAKRPVGSGAHRGEPALGVVMRSAVPLPLTRARTAVGQFSPTRAVRRRHRGSREQQPNIRRLNAISHRACTARTRGRPRGPGAPALRRPWRPSREASPSARDARRYNQRRDKGRATGADAGAIGHRVVVAGCDVVGRAPRSSRTSELPIRDDQRSQFATSPLSRSTS